MDPFQAAQPAGPQGGLLAQLAYNQAINQARTRGIVNGTPMFVGDMNAFSAMEYYQYTKQQERILQLGAIDEASNMADTMAGITHLAGREVSPQMMRGYQNLSSGIMSLAAPIAVRTQMGRRAMDFLSGGVSPSVISMSMSNVGQLMVDPMTGRQGLSPGFASRIATGLADNMRSRRTDLYGESLGFGTPSHGFSGQEIGQFLAIQQRRGMLPSTTALTDMMSSPTIHRMLDRGDITPNDIALMGVNASGVERYLSEIDSRAMHKPISESTGQAIARLRDAGFTSAETFRDTVDAERLLTYEAEQRQNDFAARAKADGEENLRALDRMVGRMFEEQTAQEDTGWTKADVAGTAANVVVGTVAGAKAGAAIGTAFGPGYGTLGGLVVGGVLGWGADKLTRKALADTPAYSIRETYGLSSGGQLAADSKAEFDHALLEIMAKGTGGLASLDKEVGADYQAALAALRSGNIDAYLETNVAKKDPIKQIEDAAQALHRSPQQVYDMMNAFVDSDGKFDSTALHRVAPLGDTSDPFGVRMMEDVEASQATGRPMGKVIQDEYMTRLSREMDQQLGALEAVRELFSDDGIKIELQEAMQLLDEITHGSANQLGGVKAEEIARKMQAASKRLNMTQDDLRSVSQLGQQVAQEFGLDAASGASLGTNYMTSLSGYADQGIDQLGIFGMSSQHQMAHSDMRVKAAALKSQEANEFAAMRRLLRLNTVNINENTEEGRQMAKFFRESETKLSQESEEYFNRKLQDKSLVRTFAEVTGKSTGMVMSASRDELANAEELARGNTGEMIFRAAAQNYVDTTLVDQLVMHNSATAMDVSGITDNREREAVSRAMAKAIARTAGTAEKGDVRTMLEARAKGLTMTDAQRTASNRVLSGLFKTELERMQADPTTRTDANQTLLDMFATDRAKFDDISTTMFDSGSTKILEAANRFSDASLDGRDYTNEVNDMRAKVGMLSADFQPETLRAIQDALKGGGDVDPLDIIGAIAKTDVTGRSAETVASITGVLDRHLKTFEGSGNYAEEYAEMKRRATAEIKSVLENQVISDPATAKKLRDSDASVQGKSQASVDADWKAYEAAAATSGGSMEEVLKTLYLNNATFNFEDVSVTGVRGTAEQLR